MQKAQPVFCLLVLGCVCCFYRTVACVRKCTSTLKLMPSEKNIHFLLKLIQCFFLIPFVFFLRPFFVVSLISLIRIYYRANTSHSFSRTHLCLCDIDTRRESHTLSDTQKVLKNGVIEN